MSNFSYKEGKSVLHQIDVRFKLICLVLLGISLLQARFTALFISTFMMTILIVHTGITFKSVLKEIRYFFILLIFILVARAFTTPGKPLYSIFIPQFDFSLTITREGVHDGILICWHLLLIVVMGLLFTATTRTSEIRAAVEWFLRPFPFVPRKQIALMLSLMIRFIPLILNQVREISDIQRARGIENRKNPIYRLIKFGIPLLRRTFQSADELIIAMEARAYSENRTEPVLLSSKKDWVALSVVILCILFMILY